MNRLPTDTSLSSHMKLNKIPFDFRTWKCRTNAEKIVKWWASTWTSWYSSTTQQRLSRFQLLHIVYYENRGLGVVNKWLFTFITIPIVESWIIIFKYWLYFFAQVKSHLEKNFFDCLAKKLNISKDRFSNLSVTLITNVTFATVDGVSKQITNAAK